MATRTPTKVLADIVSAFRFQLPALAAMGMNFGIDPLVLNQTAIAHIEQLPTIQTYDATTGYANGATSMDDLLVDIPIVIDGHKHVPVKLNHLANIANEKKYINAINNQAYVLGKAILDSLLAKVREKNLSHQVASAAASVDYDVLVTIGGTMNTNGAATTGRRAIVSTAVMNALQSDPVIASGDYHDQLQRGSSIRSLVNIAGFERIDEYPDMPTNNNTAQTFTAAVSNICTKVAHGLLTGDQVRLTTTTTLPAGLSLATDYYVIYLTADTFSLATSVVNATAGTAVDITDTGTGTHTITGYENLIGLFYEDRAFALKTGVPAQTSEYARELGIPEVNKCKVIQDPETGLGLMSIMWQTPGLLDLYATVASLWGSAVGRQGGAAGAITDKAAVRLVTA